MSGNSATDFSVSTSPISPEIRLFSQSRLYPGSLPNEVISREVFRESPPHILITNYAMLEYLLLRHDDTPLFSGPWRFVALDEAHTYTGAKGSEVALLLRRLRHRIKGKTGQPPQYIGTSATLGTSAEGRGEKVAHFASDLFHAPFAPEDIIEARKEHAPAEGMTEPDPALYEDRSLLEGCETGLWSGTLSSTLERAGFARGRIAEAAHLGERSFEEGLYQVFRDDARALWLREAAEDPRDLGTAARMVLGSEDEAALRRLSGLVRICSLARMPGSDARLVPCRYHFFVRGLNGAFIAFNSPPDADPTPSLFLDPTNVTPDGETKTLELRVCRKCGQPYIFAYSFSGEDGRVLRAFGGATRGTRRADLADLGSTRPLLRGRGRRGGRGARGGATGRLPSPDRGLSPRPGGRGGPVAAAVADPAREGGPRPLLRVRRQRDGHRDSGRGRGCAGRRRRGVLPEPPAIEEQAGPILSGPGPKAPGIRRFARNRPPTSPRTWRTPTKRGRRAG